MNDSKHPNTTTLKFILENYNDQLSPAAFGEKLIHEIQSKRSSNPIIAVTKQRCHHAD